MKAMYFLVALALLVVVCEGNSHMTTIRNDIMSEAHTCCVSSSSCSVEQKASLRSRMNIYDGPDAQSTRDYLELALSGAACTGHGRKRAAGDYATLKCDTTPIDVQNGDVSVTCTLDLRLFAGIYTTNLDAYIYVGSNYKSIYPDNSYYYDQNATSTTFFRTYVLKFPRYSPYGNWTVSAYAYSSGYSSTAYNSTSITVLKTKNDMSPPTLTALGPSVLNINDDNKAIVFSATDDLTGCNSAYFYVMNASTTVGYASWYGGPLTAVTAMAPLSLSAGTASGIYSIYAYLYDAGGFYAYVYTSQLAAMNLTSSVTIDMNNCAAGTYRAYNTTGACTACGAGMYSKAGAFKCVTCPPGTYNANSTTCVPCPAGTSGIGASWACSPCAAGTYTYTSGNAVCIPCSPGANSSVVGATSCGYCPAGTYSTGGATQCTPCPAGSYSYGYASYCPKCTPGTYNNLAGSSQCLPCAAGTYSSLGQSSCSACPAPRVLGTANSNSQLNCYQN